MQRESVRLVQADLRTSNSRFWRYYDALGTTIENDLRIRVNDLRHAEMG